jgi:uncharacterized protein YgiM (DUF1202 family)
MNRYALAVVTAVAVGVAAKDAHAAETTEEPAEAFARVVVDSADLRSGPGVSFRVIYTAHRGETFALDGRQGGGFWLRVILPDGRRAYAMGEQVEPFAVTDESYKRPGIFAPPPLEGASAGFALVGGMLNIPIKNGKFAQYGYMEARPQLVLDKTFSIEAFIGDGLTSDGAQLFYGATFTVYLFPRWALCPFLGLGGGGLSVIPKSDSFVLQREDMFVARAGGGFMFALRNRILVRIEATNMTLFTASQMQNAQTVTGGFGVYF